MTVLQELIEYWDSSITQDEFCKVFSAQKDKLLQKEKQQIMDAYSDGQVNILEIAAKTLGGLTKEEKELVEIARKQNIDAEQYYKETYEKRC